MHKICRLYLYFFFVHKAKLQVFEFKFCQISNQQINLQLTGKILLKLGSSSCLLLEYSRESGFRSQPIQHGGGNVDAERNTYSMLKLVSHKKLKPKSSS